MSEFDSSSNADPVEEWRKPPPIPVGPARESAPLAIRGSTALETPGEQMPVLEAFQEFLAAERRRARKRMLILSGAFTAAIVALIVGGIAFTLSIMDPVQREVQALQTEVSAFERRTDRAARKADQAFDRMATQERTLADRLARNHQELAEVRADVGVRSDAVSGELSHIQTRLEQLREENTLLRKELQDVKRMPAPPMVEAGYPPWPLLPDRKTATSVDTPAPAGPVAIQPPTSAQPMHLSPPSPPTVTDHPNPDPIVLRITPSGHNAPMAWRVPLSE